jgi:hypothetical protein
MTTEHRVPIDQRVLGSLGRMIMDVKSQTWNNIAEFYRDRVEHGMDMLPMLRLVEEISASRYAHGLYAITSMHTLCLSQHPDFEYGRNMLRVDFTNDRFIFGYSESPYSRKEWQKECGRDEGLSTFEHVMRRLKWFLN